MANSELGFQIKRREFLARTLGAAAAIGGVSAGRNPLAVAGALLADSPTTHNMMVVGQKAIYLSHLPMFDMLNSQKTEFATPHRFQVLIEASFPAAQQQTYFKDRQNNPNTRMYTLSPDAFVLSNLFLPTLQTATVRSFKADVFRGHLERTAKPPDPQVPKKILSSVSVTVQRVIHAHQFGVKDSKPANLEYVLFGKGGELFLAHFISAPPDFDQILPVTVTGRTFTDLELSQGPRLTIPDRMNAFGKRLMEGDAAAADVKIGTGAAVKIQVKAAKELYFEDGELMMPPKFPQTAEEKAAGFKEEPQ